MKNYCTYGLFLFAIVLLSLQPSIAQDKPPTETMAAAKKLTTYYAAAKSENSVESKEQFFEAFPSTFLSFVNIYGFSDEDGFKQHVLYEVYHPHLEFFCSLKNTIPKKSYYEKLIGLSINGHWEADAVGLLQNCLEESIKEDLSMIISILENHSDREVSSFWYFLFDGPHPPKNMPLAINKAGEVNAHMADLAKAAFLNVQENAKLH